MRSRHALILLCAFGALMWWARLMAPATTSFAWFDNDDQYLHDYPMQEYVAERWRDGEVALWEPYQMAGMPVLATHLAGVLYPPNLLHLVLPSDLAMGALTFAHLLLASLLAFALARRLGANVAGSIAAGIVFAWSGGMIAEHHWIANISTLTWTPLIALGVLEVHRGRGSRGAGVVAVGVALQLLAGYATYQVLSAQLMVMFALACLIATARAQRRLRPVAAEAGWLLCGVAGGVLLAAPQLLPTIELLLNSPRGQGVPSGSMGFGELGTPAFEVASRAVKALTLVGCLLLPLGLCARETRMWALFFVLASALAFVLQAGASTPVYANYSSIIPWGGLVRGAHRWQAIASLCGSLAIGLGLTALLAGQGRRERLAMVTSIVLTWSVLVGTGASALLSPRSLVTVAVLVAACSLPALAAWRPAVLGPHAPRLRSAAAVVVGLAVAASIAGATRNTVLHIWQGQEAANSTRLAERYRGYAADSGGRRLLMHWEDPNPPDNAQLPQYGPKQALASKTRQFQDYEPLIPLRYAHYFSFAHDGVMYEPSTAAEPFQGYFQPGRPIKHRRLLAAASVATVLTPRRHADGSIELEQHKLADASERVSLVHGVRAATSGEATLTAIARGQVDLTAEVIVKDPPARLLAPPGKAGPEEYVRLVAESDESLEIEVHAVASGMLLVNDLDYPGWQATIDGRARRIYNANYLFRAVEIPAGTHRVSFTYEPASFRIGVWLGLLGLLLTSLLLAGPSILARARRRSG